MKLAIAIFRYFPYGGLQRDMRFIAEEAIKRGHQVTIFCGDWQGDKIPDADIRVIDTFVWFNIAGVRRFVKAFEKHFHRSEFDLLLGFNKMPGLDVYFAGDTCFAEKAFNKRNWIYRLAPRTQLYLNYEKAVFGEQSSTRIFSLVGSTQQIFKNFYNTEDKRFYLLPPGIEPGHIICKDPIAARGHIISQFSLHPDVKIILFIGSYFYRKGLDISIDVLADLTRNISNAVLVVVGADKPGVYQQQAIKLGIADKIFFLGASNQIGNLLHVADVLVHLAREELAGNVILEAMLCGCPVVVSSVCGYADYVSQYNMGKVVQSLTDTKLIVQQLADILRSEKSHWLLASKFFYESAEAFARIPVMMDFLEEINYECSSEIVDIESLRNKKVDSRNKVFLHILNNIQGKITRKMSDRETLCFSCNGKNYYLKRHYGVGWREIFKNLLQLRLPVLGASNEWKALRLLAAKGVPSLQPVTFGIKGRNPARQVSFVITDELDDVVQLDHFLEKCSLNVKQRIDLIRKIATIARDMHGSGINHRDFYLCHLMLKNQWIDGQPQVYIMDLHRAQVRAKVPERWLVKDLAALYFSSMSLPISLKDRLRFLQFYFHQPLRDIFEKNTKRISKIEKRANELFLKHAS